jgi:hypothetical protein
MFLGVGLTLVSVASLAVLARTCFIIMVTDHGASIERLSRLLEGVTGAALIIIAIKAFWS